MPMAREPLRPEDATSWDDFLLSWDGSRTSSIPSTGAGVRVDEQVWRVPAPRVRPFVSWYSGFRQAGGDPATHRGLPSPALTFIITLDDPVVIAAHPDPRQPGTYDTLIGGLHTAPALITHDGRQSGIQLALTPLGARALLGMPAGELANWDGDTAAVTGGGGGRKEGGFGRFAGELRERVLSCGSWRERFAVIDAMVARRALGASDGLAFRGVRAEVGYAWRRLAGAGGGVTVADMAAETGCSERYLSSLFRAEVGLAPKAAARVFRFDHARRARSSGSSSTRSASRRPSSTARATGSTTPNSPGRPVAA